MSKVPITKAGAEMLRQELHRLKTVDRPNVVAAIAEARAHGDLSENAEYAAARERQSLLDADGRCVFGATVDLEDQESGNKVTYQIVGDDEADLKNSKISISSPIARALIGKYAGDIAEVKAPGGTREYELLVVKYV